MRDVPVPLQSDYVTGALADQAQHQQRQVRAVPFLQGNLVEDIEIGPGATKKVRHHLGRVPSGYLVLEVYGGEGRISYTAKDASSITIKSSAATATVKVKLWVF